MCERGIDVSDNNPGINWTTVSAWGHSYAYIKATQGGSFVSPTLDSQLSGARSVDITTGIYHYADTSNHPGSDLQNFARVAKEREADSPGWLPLCLDIEVRCSDVDAWVYAFISGYWEMVGTERPFVIYAPANWWSTGYLHDDWLPVVKYWVASWGTTPGVPSWTSPQVVNHQFSSNGRVAGVPGAVDLDCSVQPIATWMLTS